MQHTINFDELADLFVKQDIFFSPAELHGFLTSHICLNSKITIQDWLSAAEDLLGIATLPTEIEDMLVDLYTDTHAQLNDNSFAFTPFILDDDYDVEEKISAISQWCQGYVVGITKYGKHLDLSITSEIKETILDLTKISQADAQDSSNSSEEKEASYMEILEYVRMAIISIYEEYSISA